MVRKGNGKVGIMETARCNICGVENDIDCFLNSDPTKPCERCIEIHGQVEKWLQEELDLGEV